LIAHGPFDPPCDHLARKTLPRPPHPVPNVRDDRETPLLWDGIRKVLEVIWGVWEPKYFCKRDSTPLSTNRPTGKSLEPLLLSVLSLAVSHSFASADLDPKAFC
jgi:hypothetical protein